MNFDLSSIKPASAEWRPQKIVLHGVQGLGKTTFGATFDKPVLLRTEDGAGAIDIPTFPLITSFNDLVGVVNEKGEIVQSGVIHALHGEHDFKTVVLDSLDWLERVVWAQTCSLHEWSSIEEPGYGKGYVESDAQWLHLMSGLDSLRLNKGMTLVLIAHTEVKKYESPETEPYDRYQIKLHKRACAIWQEWADMVLFCNYKTHIEKSEAGFNKEVSRGKGTGERVIYTEERPAFHAKNRWGLPSEIYIGQDKTWSKFHAALNESTGGKYTLPETVNQ